MAFYDANTQAAAHAALGGALATFHTPNDDPSINSYADANFLQTRLFNYVADPLFDDLHWTIRYLVVDV